MHKHEAERVICLYDAILKFLNLQNVFLYCMLDIMQRETGEATCSEMYPICGIKKGSVQRTPDFCLSECQMFV